MKTLFSFFFAAALLLTGCIQSEQDIILNPDGSGKIIMKNTMPINVMGGMEGEEIVEEANKETADLLRKSKGIDAWKDVSYTISPDSTSMTVKATGYFRDINALNSEAIVFPVVFKKQNGGMKIGIQDETTDSQQSSKTTESIRDSLEQNLSEEDIKQRMQDYRNKTKKFMGFMMMMFSDMEVSVNYHMPGSIKEIKTFKKIDENTFNLGFEGNELIDLATNEIKNDSLVREAVLHGRDSFEFESNNDEASKSEMINKIFGGSENPSAFISAPLKKQFDFDKEFQEAKKEWKKIQKEYNLDGVKNN